MNKPNPTYSELSSKQKQFIAEKGTNAQMSIPNWIRFLEPICEFDEYADKIKQKLSNKLVFLCVLAAFTLVIAFTVPLLFILEAILITAIIFLGINLNRHTRHDVNNNVRNVILPLLHVLSLEVGLKKPVTMHINFHKPMIKKDISETIDTGSFLSPNKSNFYDYQVVTLNCNFLDSTRFQLSVDDTLRARTRKSASGKTKTKTKLKRKLTLLLNFDAALYQQKLPIQSATTVEKFKLTPERIKYKAVIKQSVCDTFAELPMAELLAAIEKPYQQLTKHETIA